jgi:hypothetical protein
MHTRHEGEYDFGYLLPKEERGLTLTVCNPYSAPVRIVRARTRGKCVIASVPQKTFRPGEPLTLDVKFIAPGKPVRYARRLYIETSDSKWPLLWVVIKAGVGLPLEVSPEEPHLGTVALGKAREMHVTIRNRSDRPARILWSTSTLRGCVLKAPRKPVPAGGELKVPVTIWGDLQGERAVRFNAVTDVLTQQDFIVRATFRVTAPPEQERNKNGAKIENGELRDRGDVR